MSVYAEAPCKSGALCMAFSAYSVYLDHAWGGSVEYNEASLGYLARWAENRGICSDESETKCSQVGAHPFNRYVGMRYVCVRYVCMHALKWVPIHSTGRLMKAITLRQPDLT